MLTFLQRLYGALRRVFPAGGTHAQAIAFNMFIAFFPMLLVALGLIAASTRLTSSAQTILRDLRHVLPPGSSAVVLDFLSTELPVQWRTLLLLGATGTLLTGTQVIAGFLAAFRDVYRDTRAPHYLIEQLRSLLLLAVTFLPLVVALIITIFGQQLRNWMIRQLGLPAFFNALWVVVYGGLALVTAMLILALLYRAGCSGARSWNDVLPGAALATVLWWGLNAGLGYYVRRVPYSVVYGSLAAAIGLMIWMNLIALVVILGAAYNAERAAMRGAR